MVPSRPGIPGSGVSPDGNPPHDAPVPDIVRLADPQNLVASLIPEMLHQTKVLAGKILMNEKELHKAAYFAGMASVKEQSASEPVLSLSSIPRAEAEHAGFSFHVKTAPMPF
jgi:hypothetical protein